MKTNRSHADYSFSEYMDRRADLLRNQLAIRPLPMNDQFIARAHLLANNYVKTTAGCESDPFAYHRHVTGILTGAIPLPGERITADVVR